MVTAEIAAIRAEQPIAEGVTEGEATACTFGFEELVVILLTGDMPFFSSRHKGLIYGSITEGEFGFYQWINFTH